MDFRRLALVSCLEGRASALLRVGAMVLTLTLVGCGGSDPLSPSQPPEPSPGGQAGDSGGGGSVPPSPSQPPEPSPGGQAGDSGGGGSAPPSPSQPPEPSPGGQAGDSGRYVGTVTIDGKKYYGDALVTVEGAVRLYVGGAYADDGTVQRTRPEVFSQFIKYADGSTDNGGVLVWQGCCGDISANLGMEVSSTGDLTGELKILNVDGTRPTWSLDLRSWDNYYTVPASLEQLAGQYAEELAPFAPDGDVVVNIEENGQMFFQSAATGCIGNGTVHPHLDSAFNVFDVVLHIDGCRDEHRKWNGTHDGLGTTSPSNYWAYDTLLRIWFTNRHDWDVPRNAFLMSGRRL